MKANLGQEMKKKAPLILIFVLISHVLLAVQVHFVSTEWLVDSCPIIISCHGMIVYEKFKNTNSTKQDVTFLKCKGSKPSIEALYSNSLWSPNIKENDEVVVFFRRDLQNKILPIFLIDISNPQPFWNYCMNKNGDFLKGREKILSLIIERIKMGKDSERTSGLEELRQKTTGCKTLPYSYFKKGYSSDWRVYLTIPTDDENK